MARKLRYVPPGGFLVETSLRCIEGHYFLRPSRRLNQIVAGVLARAQRRASIRMIGLTVLSNHLHLQLWAENTKQLSDFMAFAAGNLAREINILLGRRGPVWEKRYTSILVAPEEGVQIARLRYFLEQGCKEGLVASPRQWPGVHLASAILSGKPIQGIWVDRAGFYKASRSEGKRPRLIDFELAETLEFNPLPCWAHLSPEDYRQRVREMVEDIEEETASRHQAAGTRPVGRRRVLARSPFHKPGKVKRRPTPLVLASTKTMGERIRAAYREFVQQFRLAAQALKQANPDFGFPEGAFPPALPFARPGPIAAPG